MASSTNLDLVPSLVGSGEFHTLLEHGETVSAVQSPLGNSLAVFITPTSADAKSKSGSSEDQPIYFSGLHQPPSSERRLFITDTFEVFNALQELIAASDKSPTTWLQDEAFGAPLRKLAIDYVTFIRECWVHASQPLERPGGPLQFKEDHYRVLYTCFSLFVVLAIPEPGYEQAPVGDELMEWLNTHFIEPSTEEGDHLSSLDKPWEDETFWPYLTRAILRGLTKASLFFLEILSNHPSQHLVPLTEILISIIQTQPHLQAFNTEREFAIASRRWKDKVKALRIDMDHVPESERQDDFENWWESLSDIVGILEGRGEVLKRVCESFGADWKEVCAAWGIFIDPRLRRQDLPDLVTEILSEIPPDPTNLEDNIHAALLAGQYEDALEQGYKLDPWISAHMADLMEPLGLTDPEIDEQSGLSQRDFYTLAYAEYLQSDPALWRITIEYMYSCAEPGKRRGDEVLLHVPLKLHEQANNPTLADRVRSGDVVGTLKDINKSCMQHRRENVRRTVCKIAAQAFIQEKNYGLAASYCISAENWFGLGRIVDHVLEDYIHDGSSRFIDHASALAPVLPTLKHQDGINGIFYERMIFTVRFAQFHKHVAQHRMGDAAADLVAIFEAEVAPSSWWAIVLNDAIELLEYEADILFSWGEASLLLRKLDEVATKCAQGASAECLTLLARTIPDKSVASAGHRLQVVRLALARYFARAAVCNA